MIEIGSVNLLDYAMFEQCLEGPMTSMNTECAWTDLDADDTITLRDFAVFQSGYTSN